MISALDEIAWLLNLRGNDIDCNPVFLSYMLIADEACRLYINDAILNNEIIRKLVVDGITIYPYNEIYTDLKRLPGIIYMYKQEADDGIAGGLPDQLQIKKLYTGWYISGR